MMTSSGPWPGINSCGRYMIGFEPPLWDDQLFSASHHSLFQGMPSLRRAEQGSRSRAAGGPPPKAGDIPLDGLSRPSTLAAALVDRPSRSENHATFRKLLNLLPNLPRSLGNSANLVLRISAGAKKRCADKGLASFGAIPLSCSPTVAFRRPRPRYPGTRSLTPRGFPGDRWLPGGFPSNFRQEAGSSNYVKKMVHPERFEPPASAFGGQRSIQLSYGCTGPHAPNDAMERFV